MCPAAITDISRANARWIKLRGIFAAIRPAGTVRRAEPLRDDALTTERAGVPVDDRAIPIEMLIQHNAGIRAPQKPRQRALTFLNR